jgi:protein involved in polysaccharide export with SLBB domain
MALTHSLARPPMKLIRILVSTGAAVGFILASGCASSGAEPFSPKPRPTADFPNIGYAAWTDEEPPYRLYAGDEVEITIPSAPELSKTVTVQPDGRVSLPLIQPVMVADRTVSQAAASLSDAYAAQLLRPDVSVAVKTATPLKIFVGGEVDKAGVYDMPGAIDALQAVIMAGGFKTGAKRDQVVIIRRGPDGRAMMRTADLRKGAFDPAHSDAVPLRRFDIVYVPRTSITEVGLFVQQYVRDVIPATLGFSYSINPAYSLPAAASATP